eukprot:Pgem_evm1s16993
MKIFPKANKRNLFVAVVLIGGVEFGVGECANKKAAKKCAAIRTLNILIPKSFPHELEVKGESVYSVSPELLQVV